MIKGHENLTNELNDEELWLANEMIKFFHNKTKENPVKSVQIVNGVNNHYKLKKRLTDVRLRKIINYYRVNAIIPIISTQKGYYLSYELEDIDNMIQSLTQRASSILECALGLERIKTKLEK